MPELILGQVLVFENSPFDYPMDDATQYHRHGAILVDDGKIVETGPAENLKARHNGVPISDMGNALLLPGFVDAHVHYAQTAIIASGGLRLIDWLNTVTFPEESRFSNRDYADEVANRYFDLVLSHGTTSTCSYCTSDPTSVTAYFSAAQARGLRVWGGKTCMDRNALAALLDTPQRAYDESRALAEKWHGVDRLSYVVTPRFAPTSTPEQLEAMGALWAQYPDALMQTHLSEQPEEIEWVRELFPEAQDYLDVYARFGLLGERGVYGHAIHLTEREQAVIAETGAGLAHCPTSNSFIGSGIMPLRDFAAAGMRIGLATDTGGGSSFSMLRTMAAAYEFSQLCRAPLNAAQLLWLASEGAARILHAEGQIGTLRAGAEADIIALDLASTPAISQAAQRAETLWQAIFPTIMMGDDRAIVKTWVAGRAI